MTCAADMAVKGEEKWKHLLEWLHAKGDHPGFKDLFKGAVTWELWPGTWELCNTVIFVCGQCYTGLEKQHPLQEASLH